MIPFPITHKQIQKLGELATEAQAHLRRFIDNPIGVLTSMFLLLGVQLELVADDDGGQVAGEDDARGPELSPRVADLVPIHPPAGIQPASPAALLGTSDMLGGRKGKITGPAGPGSWHVLLEDGTDCVLTSATLHLAGCEVPPAPAADDVAIEANGRVQSFEDERTRGWRAMIRGRQGTTLRECGPGSYVVRFPDSEEVVLPEAALPLAGCRLPGR